MPTKNRSQKESSSRTNQICQINKNVDSQTSYRVSYSSVHSNGMQATLRYIAFKFSSEKIIPRPIYVLSVANRYQSTVVLTDDDSVANSNIFCYPNGAAD